VWRGNAGKWRRCVGMRKNGGAAGRRRRGIDERRRRRSANPIARAA
jgi:hypothetical protein